MFTDRTHTADWLRRTYNAPPPPPPVVHQQPLESLARPHTMTTLLPPPPPPSLPPDTEQLRGRTVTLTEPVRWRYGSEQLIGNDACACAMSPPRSVVNTVLALRPTYAEGLRTRSRPHPHPLGTHALPYDLDTATAAMTGAYVLLLLSLLLIYSQHAPCTVVRHSAARFAACPGITGPLEGTLALSNL